MSCEHKFGKVEKDGYQYCKNCGEAKKPIDDNVCKHIWHTTEKSNYVRNSGFRNYYVSVCEKCGEIKIIRG